MLGRYGANSPNWKGGRRLSEHGYVLLCKPKHPRNRRGYVFEHIIVFEEFHKCCVLRSGSIHHINHNRQDNSIENLELMGKSMHAILHNIVEDMTERICCKCGSNQTYAYNGGTPQWIIVDDGFMCSRCFGRKRDKLYRLRKKIFSTQMYAHVPTE